MKIEKLLEQTKQMPWDSRPKIGWWLDNNPVRFYHGTHIRNLEGILENGIYAPKEGYTAGWVSLALEPNTAFGYAAMSGSGGETNFRSLGTKATSTPANERVVFVLEIPQSYFQSKMGTQGGNVEEYRDRLTNPELYKKWKEMGKSDAEYYAITEIRIPKHVPVEFIVGWMKK